MRFICEYGPDKAIYALEIEAASADAAEAIFRERLPDENLLSVHPKDKAATPQEFPTLDHDECVVEEREDA